MAGPIVRASEFVGQLGRKRPFRWPLLSWGLFLVLLGYFHKSVLADNLAVVSDGYFDGTPHGEESFLIAWFGVYAFAGHSRRSTDTTSPATRPGATRKSWVSTSRRSRDRSAPAG